MSEYAQIKSELLALVKPEKGAVLARFFKTGKGEYGEGDRFHGVVVPDIRKVARAHRRASRGDLVRLLDSRYHEERLAALLIMIEQYRSGDVAGKQAIYDLYLASTDRINNWDLVDLSAPQIVGAHLTGTDNPVLTSLARSKSLWERRIAMLSTFHYIRKGECREALRIAELLVGDPHDLIHKAVGWMLREIGKRCSIEDERGFLDRHAVSMPRTMLRYAIEKFPEPLRREYMEKRV